MRRRRNRFPVTALPAMFIVLLAGAANAEGTAGAATDSPWTIGVALGYGERSNPLVNSDDIRIAVDLDLAWFGDRWFFDNGDGGLTFIDNERFTLSAVGRINSDRVFFSRTDIEGISLGISADATPFDPPDRDYAIESGVELLSDGAWGYLQAGLFFDISDTHKGYSADIILGRVFRRNRWSVESTLGASYKSQRLNDYYWGLRPSEANLLYPPYTADAGLNASARLGIARQLTRRWSFALVGEYERLSSAIRHSPMVTDNGVRSVYAGFRRHGQRGGRP